MALFFPLPPIKGLSIAASSLLLWFFALPSLANPITPGPDSSTQVTQSGNDFTITGGAIAGDGQTLFHDFEQFGLSADQAATFLARPDVQAILGRVTGGNASYIDGLLRVTGSSADLYLINPAGILFGTNAQLDLSGSFAATTASGLQFEEGVFYAIGSNDYEQLVGAPTGYLFTTDTAGAIANAADLAVAPGESITLIGGQVVSTGTLTAPEGEIAIAAIPDASLVRISHPEMVLNLELQALTSDAAQLDLPFTPLALPALLTGGNPQGATGVSVQPDGTLILINTEIANLPGTVIATGDLDVSGPVGGDITVVGDQVGLIAATVNASGEAGGGTVRIGGDYQGQPTLPGSTLTVVDNASTITANGGITGNGGRVILWSDSTTLFEGAIATQGGNLGGNGGFVEVSGAETLGFHGEVDTTASTGITGELLLDPTDIVIRNGTADGNDTDALANILSEPVIAFADAGPTEIFESELEGLLGNATVTLRASNSITLEDLADNALTFQTGPGQISFEAGGAFTVADLNDAIIAPQRTLLITANTITTGTLNTGDLSDSGGNIILAAIGDVTVSGLDTRGDPSGLDRGGDVSITTAGTITVGAIDTTGDAMGLGSGHVALTGSSIRTGQISAGGGFANASQVTLTATTGDVIVETISAGGGGLIVNAANRFQALGTFDANVRITLNSATDAALIDFLMRGNPQPLIDAGLIDTAAQVFITFPTSILTGPGVGGTGDIVINHGGQATTFSDGNITIQGSGANPLIQFVAGPNADHTIDIDPVVPDANFFGFTTLFSAGTFPSNASGTTGAILRGAGDSTLVTSFQNQLFLPNVNTTGLEQLARDEEEGIELTTEDEGPVVTPNETTPPNCEADGVIVTAETVEIVDNCDPPDGSTAE